MVSSSFATSSVVVPQQQKKQALYLFLNISSSLVNTYYPKRIEEKELLVTLDRLIEKNSYKTNDIYGEIKKLFVDDISGFYTRDEFIKKYRFLNDKSKIQVKYIKDILYLKIEYLNNTNLKLIQKELSKKPKKIIIDFRNNQFSEEDAMVSLANMLIDHGVIFTKRYIEKNKTKTKIFKADKKSMIINSKTKIAILVNHKTNSTAEVFAHSLGYHTNIITIGQETAGKTPYLTISQLPNDEYMVLETGEYFYSIFYVINKVGKKPEIWISEDNKKLDKTLIRATQWVN